MLFAFLAACEKPQQRTVEVKEEPVEQVAPQASPVVAPPVAAAPEAATPAPPRPPAPEVPAVKLPEEEPDFKMWMSGKRITISGALKSKIQVDRILGTVTVAFPGYEIVNDLKVEYHRIPVGWGNRIADELLVPYFKEVESPEVAYKKGIVTLIGEVENTLRHKQLTEIAIDAFAGDMTQNIDNKIKVKR